MKPSEENKKLASQTLFDLAKSANWSTRPSFSVESQHGEEDEGDQAVSQEDQMEWLAHEGYLEKRRGGFGLTQRGLDLAYEVERQTK